MQNNFNQDWEEGSILEAELFLELDNRYHALYKIDTTFLSKLHPVSDLIEKTFAFIIQKTENKMLSQMHIGKTGFAITALEQYVARLKSVPILQDSVLQKIVYATLKNSATTIHL